MPKVFQLGTTLRSADETRGYGPAGRSLTGQKRNGRESSWLADVQQQSRLALSATQTILAILAHVLQYRSDAGPVCEDRRCIASAMYEPPDRDRMYE